MKCYIVYWGRPVGCEDIIHLSKPEVSQSEDGRPESIEEFDSIDKAVDYMKENYPQHKNLQIKI